MRLEFDPEDGDHGDEYEEARDRLLERFEASLARGGGGGHQDAQAVGDAAVALDWKWGYGDGHLARWAPADVAEFLLEWCPRKLSITQDECVRLPEALSAYFRFLHDSGLVPAGSAPLSHLLATVEHITPEYVAAMGDPSKFGMAKSFFAAATADGVDVGDPGQVEGWMAEFNARPEDERRLVLSDRVLGLDHAVRPQLPPVARPDDEAVRASAAEAPILSMFASLADYVGKGRKLTQKGHLTLADARVLVGLLGTGDVMDEVIGERTFRTRSSAELGGLHLVFTWAKKAGVVRVVHGKVVATKRGAGLARDRAAFFDRAVRALLDAGPLSIQRDPERWLAWPEVDALLDRFTVSLLSAPYVAQGPVPLEDLAAGAADAVLRAFVFPALPDDEVAKLVTRDVTDMVDVLELAGVALGSGAEAPSDPWARRRLGGDVALTPAGVDIVARLLGEAGYDTPEPRFAGASALDLLVGTDHADFAALAGELEAWRQRRSPEQAAAEMADAARRVDDPALVNLALGVLSAIGVDVSAPFVRQLAAEPERRGFALCWLVDHGLEPSAALYDQHDVECFVDVLAHRLVAGGPDQVASTLAVVGNHEQQLGVLARMWRVRSGATSKVLEAVGRAHSVKAVAKAARKAALQHRSWLANG